jgi:two-component system, OmpR family, alkaline phosphatase synthesis response regulator PhoP
MSAARILVVDDDTEMGAELTASLEMEGYDVALRGNGRSGLEMARKGNWDLLILEMDLPGLDGIRIVQTVRREGVTTPILVLTTRTDEASKVLAFRTGADDYVTKPFHSLELLARVDALLRRTRLYATNGNGRTDSTSQGPLRFADVEVNPDTRVVQKAGQDVALTPKEFDLLLALVQRGGKVASRKELLREVWNHRAPVESRTVDTHMAELRRKLEEDPSQPRHLLTVRKVGYRCEA